MATLSANKPQPTSTNAVTSTAGAKQVANPFTRASWQKAEPLQDQFANLGTNAVKMEQVDVPSGGYLRHIVIDIRASGFTGGAYNADGVFSLIQQATLLDTNGQPVVDLLGYELMLANLLGGYTQHADPTDLEDYVASATNIRFKVRIPVEIIQRNAYGSLSNLNATQPYRVQLRLAPAADVFSAITGTATVEASYVAEQWANPLPTDIRGVANMTTPPQVGTTQNWTSTTKAFNAGQFPIRLPRVGNAIRNLIFVCRDAATQLRTDALWPSEITWLVGGNIRHRVPIEYFYQRFHELYGSEIVRPTGVLVFPYTNDFDDTPGGEMGDYYLQTSGSSRLELQGVWKGAGSLTIVTNDILASSSLGGPGETLGG